MNDPCGLALTIISGNGQSGEAGTGLAEDLVLSASITRGSGNCTPRADAGETIHWVTTSGSVPATSTTDATGVTGVRWTLGSQLGAQTATAYIRDPLTNRTLASANFGATVLSTPYVVLRKVLGEGQSAPAGQLVPIPPTVELILARDAGPQLPRQETPIALGFINWSITAGAGLANPTVSITGSDGRAFTQWRLGPAAGAHQLQAVAQTAAAPPDPRDVLTVSFGATAVTAPVDRVRVTPAQASVTITQAPLQLTAEALDAAGAVIPGRSFSWNSSNNAIATVSASGLVTALAGGQAVITATETLSQKNGTATVSVAPVIRVRVNGAGNGSGLVTSTGLPEGDLSCTSSAGVTSGGCDESFSDADGSGTFNLVATPSPGSGFSAWTGCSSTSGSTCRLDYNSTSDVSFNVTARFDLLPGGTELIAFESDRTGDNEIYTVKPDGSGLTRLTFNPASDREPAWSPDGSKLAFVSDRTGDYEIYVMNADGTGVTRLTFDPAVDREPWWSPDGQKLVFWSERDGDREIYRINADGSGLTRLSNDPNDDEDAVWTPDGRIVFASNRAGGFLQLYLMNADGTGVQRLSFSSNDDEEPAVSPNGVKLVFTRTPLNGTEELYVMNFDGTNLVRLTANGATDSDPVWSPDGTRIAFMSDRNGTEEVYIMNADGTGVVRLTPGSKGGSPAWVRRP